MQGCYSQSIELPSHASFKTHMHTPLYRLTSQSSLRWVLLRDASAGSCKNSTTYSRYKQQHAHTLPIAGAWCIWTRCGDLHHTCTNSTVLHAQQPPAHCCGTAQYLPTSSWNVGALCTCSCSCCSSSRPAEERSAVRADATAPSSKDSPCDSTRLNTADMSPLSPAYRGMIGQNGIRAA